MASESIEIARLSPDEANVWPPPYMKDPFLGILYITLPPVPGEIDPLRTRVLQELAILLKEYSHPQEEQPIRQALDCSPAEFFSSFTRSVASLAVISPDLCSKAMDLVYARCVFKIDTSDTRFGNKVLEDLGTDVSQRIKFIHFHLDNPKSPRDNIGEYPDPEEAAAAKLDMWKGAMGNTGKLLSYNGLHVTVTSCMFGTETGEAAVNIMRSLPQMKQCSARLVYLDSKQLWNDVRAVVKQLTSCERDLQKTKSFPAFQKFSLLPKELRLLVLSFSELVPVVWTPNRPPTWHISDHRWSAGKMCCQKCSPNPDWYIWNCCCKRLSCAYSTTCVCDDGFTAMLSVSRRFRAEALEVLFSNTFSFSSTGDLSMFAYMQWFLKWPSALSHLSYIKGIDINLSLRDWADWSSNQVLYESTMTNLLKTLRDRCKEHITISLKLNFLRPCYNETWALYDWPSAKKFESSLCEAVERLYSVDSERCMVFIDWGKENPDFEATSLATRSSIGIGLLPVAKRCQRSMWLLNSPKTEGEWYNW